MKIKKPYIKVSFDIDGSKRTGYVTEMTMIGHNQYATIVDDYIARDYDLPYETFFIKAQNRL